MFACLAVKSSETFDSVRRSGESRDPALYLYRGFLRSYERTVYSGLIPNCESSIEVSNIGKPITPE